MNFTGFHKILKKHDRYKKLKKDNKKFCLSIIFNR